MLKIDEDKLAGLATTNQMLDEKYGPHGSATRNAFNEELGTYIAEMNQKEDLLAKGKNAFEPLRKEAITNGLSSLTLEEINKEISETIKTSSRVKL